ncbi:MAG: DUF885 domain-containing protein [Pseudomonadota bacterium]
MLKAVRRFIAALLLAACSEAQIIDANPTEEAFSQIIQDHWDLMLSEDPILAESLGHDEARGQLPDPSLEAYQNGVRQRRVLLSRLGGIDTSLLTNDEALNHSLLVMMLKDATYGNAPGVRYLTINTYSAPHTRLARIAEQTQLHREEDYQSYMDRLARVPVYMEGAIERLRTAIEKGWTQPCAAMTGFERTFETHIVDDPEASVFLTPFAKQGAVTDAAHARRREDAAGLIRDGVIPAFEAFGAFYTDEYKPACREEVGLSSLPGGGRYYQHLTRVFTTTSLTPDEVHEIGLSEVARIRAEMRTVALKAGFERLSAFQNHLRTAPDYYPQTAKDRLATASTIAKTMDGKLVELFGHLPRMPYTIRPIPSDVAEGTTTAYYSQPAADGSQPGIYWLNTTKLETRPLYELEALTLHEAVPGHHLQIAISQELDLPNFRRFGGFTAFTEGWGLYAERLGLEVGFYDAPETNFGRLSYEMWRACRLVVDTGMHYKGWTRQRAIDYMLENTGLSQNNITREVDRYITWPAQALAYKIGELKIRELRRQAEDALGQDFDVRRFHDAVLENGAIPLSVLELKIEHFIAEERKRLRLP